jgi:hypothetical protein
MLVSPVLADRRDLFISFSSPANGALFRNRVIPEWWVGRDLMGSTGSLRQRSYQCPTRTPTKHSRGNNAQTGTHPTT